MVRPHLHLELDSPAAGSFISRFSVSHSYFTSFSKKMSSQAIAAATQHFLQFRIQYASIALIYWDYALTLRDEIQYMWSSKGWLKLSKLLYILCRYSLLANVMYMLAVSGKLGSNCDTWYKGLGVISVLGRAAVLTAFTMRAYAVWSQNKLVLVGLGLMALTCVILDCVSVSTSISSHCSPEGLDVSYIFQVYNAPVLQALRSLIHLGVLYFSVISCFTVAAVVLNYRAPNNIFQRLLNALTLPLSGIFTARFLLHLRAADASRTGSSNVMENARIGGAEDIVFRREVSTFETFSSAVIDGFGEDPVFAAINRSKTASNASANDNWDDTHARTFDEESMIGFAREEYKNNTATGKTDSCSSFDYDFYNVGRGDVGDFVFVVYTTSIEAMALP
ncbi:hypothetical protein D9619_012516 [Psilocybe cf. subviscida]|uniref:DUF6533 domain-containing protein n=1 Tax=Psilocybe cf. subviscida TaxID=2480587 RepID=A0A8H5EZ37_9AGAR|nr:hypothetical protein D9619_012516 [Psilocybe cf. subviscida]